MKAKQTQVRTRSVLIKAIKNLFVLAVLGILTLAMAGCGNDSEMVYVQEGSFQMGCDASTDPLCLESSKPVHQVSLEAYLIDRTEVTVKAFMECVDAGVCSHHMDDGTCHYIVWETGETDEGQIWEAFRQPDLPMSCVDWTQAAQYCEWTGKRLPTEAEWEKAARGTSGLIYPWGSQSPDCSRAVVLSPTDLIGGCGDQHTADVCSRSPKGDSPYGLCDMVGNVSEWVADWYDNEYYSISPVEDPQGPTENVFALGELKAVRGGSFIWDGATTYQRDAADPVESAVYTGFRCARAK